MGPSAYFDSLTMSYYVTRQLGKAIDKLREELNEALHEQIDAIRDSTKATRESKQDPLPSPLTVRAETHTAPAEQTEQRTQYGHSQTIQILLTIGTWLAFLAAAIYAGIAARQWKTMEKTYGEIQKQTV